MASPIRRMFQHPTAVTLTGHALSAMASGVIVAVVGIAAVRSTGAGTPLAALARSSGVTPYDIPGTFLLWAMVGPLGLTMVFTLVMGLAYGRWGLPGHLQGGAVFYVPPLAAVYFVIGTFVLHALAIRNLHDTWREGWAFLTAPGGAALLVIYVALSTAAVGLGWAAALAVADHQRRRGKWETISYLEPRP